MTHSRLDICLFACLFNHLVNVQKYKYCLRKSTKTLHEANEPCESMFHTVQSAGNGTTKPAVKYCGQRPRIPYKLLMTTGNSSSCMWYQCHRIGIQNGILPQLHSAKSCSCCMTTTPSSSADSEELGEIRASFTAQVAGSRGLEPSDMPDLIDAICYMQHATCVQQS